ncbi:hypothetical protein RCOM_0726150 [Ricinus communis]|uniref:Uncharacterized protein n=1 Tax=Ricinus communis TaxID=3988 RepID=B9SFY8_RICCO|nr:hypothetical protein RCOM_0726150 [Ricinus communis]
MQEVQWGMFTMVEAERRLLANALLDFSNQRFVLLSESCIPLFNLSTIYHYLMSSKKSYVEVYDLSTSVGRGRYNPRMRPTVRLSQWRKGSQWFEMDRSLAIEGGPHPNKFGRLSVTEEFLERLRKGFVCTYNGKTSHICFLFARKFMPNALDRLLRFSPKIMQF